MPLSRRVPLLFVALAALAAIGAVPAVAEGESAAPARTATDAAPLGDCGPAPPADLASLVLEPAEAPVCSAEPRNPTGKLFVVAVEQQGPPIKRYCQCGCGITCETDADCGPDGSCVAFITCC